MSTDHRRKQDKLLSRTDTQKQLTAFIELFKITVNDKLIEHCGVGFYVQLIKATLHFSSKIPNRPTSTNDEVAVIKEINFFEKPRKNSWLKEGLKKGLKAVDFV